MLKTNEIQKYTTKQMYEYCTKTDLCDLHSLKLHLDDLYYNTPNSEISDILYDILKDILIKRDPMYIPPIGAKIRNNENRTKIPFYMGSADKITPTEQKELDRWVLKNQCNELLVSEKLDGVSGIFTCKNGKKKLYTRGDGEIGADISYLIQYITSIPNIEDDISVRGELIIKKNVFKKKFYSDGKKDSIKDNDSDRLYRNARNMVAGLVGAKTVRHGINDIEFVVYEEVGNETMPCPLDQMKKLKKLGFTTAAYKSIKITEKMDDLVSLHDKFKHNSEYEIDGIVIQSNIPYDRNTSGNPSYLFAFKVCNKDSIHETLVLDVEWCVSSWGQIVPVAIINPIELPGNTIKRVTISNAGLMRSKGIGPGAIINVTRSKEVIPFIVNVVKECKDFKWPDIEYEWDDNEVHLNVVDASQEIVAIMRVKLFSKFFAKMGIKHVSSATITKLYSHGFDTLLKIIAVTEKDLVEIEGIQKKSASRIVTNIREGLKGVNAPNLLGACGVFGFGVGRKRVISLMTDIPDILSVSKRGLKKRILEIDGFSEIIAEKVFRNIDYAIEFINQISKYVSFEEDTRVSDTLVGKKFCFSGFRSKELEQNIIDRGGNTTTSVSAKTSGIIVDNKSTNQSGKVIKAIECGVKVYTKEEFIKIYISVL
jgi:DNA ligase (NAD+)